MRFAALLLISTGFLLPQQQASFDVVITGARVVDGGGSPCFYADIGIRGDTIAAIGLLADAPSRTRIDARGLTVTPGFIDVHNHSYPAIFDQPTAPGFLLQGVTTMIGGPDGSSPLPMKAAFDRLAAHKMSVNMALCVGHGSVRQQVLKMENRAPTPAELNRMRELVRDAMKAGAIGLSTGLFYTPANFAATEEVIELAKVTALYGGFHVSHIRDEGNGLLDSVKETIRIGEEGGLPTQITHHKVGGLTNKGKSVETLRLVEEARARGVDVTIDQYPYTASHTSLGAALFPQNAFAGGNASLLERLSAPEQRARIKAEIVRRIEGERGGGDPKNIVLTSCAFDRSLQQKSLSDILRARGQQPTIDNAAELAMEIQKKGGCSATFHWIFEEDIERILKYPFTMVASDGSITMAHPRSNGTFVRVLGRYVRERKVITFEDAVRKMSGLPAQRLRIYDRGLIRPGMKADLVILDPAKVADRATFEKPMELPVGIRDVLVNGRVAVRDGKITAERAGRVLYGPGYQAPK
ncbi:MAG: D-aminoacylase [Candidatus Solibacter usitatus]|nr:D-aminoacylase [Candidatus Solibacter usitatus]